MFRDFSVYPAMITEIRIFWKLLAALNTYLLSCTLLFPVLFFLSFHILYHFLTAMVTKLDTFIELGAAITGRYGF